MNRREIKKAFKTFVQLEGIGLDYFKDGYNRDDAERYADLLTRFTRSLGITDGRFFIDWHGDDSELAFEQRIGEIEGWDIRRSRNVFEPLAGQSDWLDEFIKDVAIIRRTSKRAATPGTAEDGGRG